MKLGNKEIPEFRLSSTLLGDLKTIYEKVGLSEIDQEVAAQIIGHKSAKSGTFLTKVASMRDYGLIEGRGKFKVTDIGERIAFHRDDKDYNDSLIRAVLNIPLWRILYDKYTKKGLDIPAEDFWYDLKEYCDLTIEQAKNLAPDVRQDFKEDIKQIRIGLDSTSGSDQKMNEVQSQKVTTDALDLNMEGIRLFIPKGTTSEAWKKVVSMGNAYTGEVTAVFTEIQAKREKDA